jgi:RNA polymerase sigma factor (sigma-70 family)
MEEIKTLVEQSQSGDVDAFGRLVKRFQAMAYGSACSYLGDFHLAEDAAQEAFVEAYRSIGQLRAPEAFPGWFRRIVVKHCDRITRRHGLSTVPIENAATVADSGPLPDRVTEDRELHRRVMDTLRSLPEHQRTTTMLFYIDGYSQSEISEFLDVPVTTVKKRLYDARTNLKEKMLDMVEETLKQNALPDEFTDLVVRRATSEDDLQRVVDLMGGVVGSVEEAREQEMFVVGEPGKVVSAGHLGTTRWGIGGVIVKAARSMAGVSGEAAGLPDPRFKAGYQAHFRMAREEGCRLVAVHGSLYDHAMCGFVPTFRYPIVRLPVTAARSVSSDASVRKTEKGPETQAGVIRILEDLYTTRMSAGMGGGPVHAIEIGGRPAGYMRVDPKPSDPGKPGEMRFGRLSYITVESRAAALAAIRMGGELAQEDGRDELMLMESHASLITRTMLSLGGSYLLRPCCDLPGLDSEMVAIVDLPGLTADLAEILERRVRGCDDTALSIEMGGETVGFRLRSGRLAIRNDTQEKHLKLPRWVMTRLYVGYHSGEDVLDMGPIPWDRNDGHSPDDPKLDNQVLELSEREATLFRLLFPRLWPVAMPDPDVWPWVIGEKHPMYQHEEEKSDEMKGRIDALRFPWVGY